MSDGLVDLIEEWQTGFFLVVGSVAAGVLAAFALGRLGVPHPVVVGLLGGTAAAFVVLSYLLPVTVRAVAPSANHAELVARFDLVLVGRQFDDGVGLGGGATGPRSEALDRRDGAVDGEDGLEGERDEQHVEPPRRHPVEGEDERVRRPPPPEHVAARPGERRRRDAGRHALSADANRGSGRPAHR